MKTKLTLITPKSPESSPSVMERDVYGNIASWNRAAEYQYGFVRSQAVGSVSHKLLSTVFPYPLSEINNELLARNVWEGELIHTVRDGSRVKVLSRWELYRDETGEMRVREINAGFLPVDPENAQLTVRSFKNRFENLTRVAHFLKKHAFWLVAPIITVILIFVGIWFLTHDIHFAPLLVNH